MNSKNINISKVDKNFDNTNINDESVTLRCINPADSFDVSIYGLPFFEEERQYCRVRQSELPMIASLSEGLRTLVDNPSGGLVAFFTNASTFKIRVKLSFMFNLAHMPYTGQAGFDLYRGNNLEDLRFFRTSSFNFKNYEYEFTFLDKVEHKKELFMLNFPLYASVEKLEIMVNDDAIVEPAKNLFPGGKIVIYGTSITQGGCASRPGNNFTAILSRKLKREFINFGFSGNGHGQKEMADIINEINNVEMIIIDYEANAGRGDMMNQTLPVFVNTLRDKHPKTPILVVSQPPVSEDLFFEASHQFFEIRKGYQRDLVEKRNAEGDNNIYFYDGKNLFGELSNEGTVDGVHPNDAGFVEMARHLLPVIQGILKKVN